MASKVQTRVKTKPGFDASKYLYGYATTDDVTKVITWYEYNQAMSIDGGAKVWLFMKSKTDPNEVYSRQFEVSCDGGTPVCSIKFTGISRKNPNNCKINFVSVKKKTQGACTISFVSIKKKGAIDNATNEPVPDPTWTYGNYGLIGGKDYNNKSFITSVAPQIPYSLRAVPFAYGINYKLAEQTALFVGLHRRFPAFSLQDRKVHVMGPWYNSDVYNDMFTRGITTMTTLPELRKDTNPRNPQDVRVLPQSRKNEFLGDPEIWAYAVALAQELEAGNVTNNGEIAAQVAALRTFGIGHTATLNEGAYKKLGARIWQGEKNVVSFDAKGMAIFTIDVEHTANFDYHVRTCQGWIYQGFLDAAANEGITVRPLAYGNLTFQVQIHGASDLENGLPRYLSNAKDVFSTNDPLLQAFNQYKGVLTIDAYLRGIWGTAPFYQRNGDGSLIYSGGQPQFVGETTTISVHGQSINTEPNEAKHCMSDLYTHAAHILAFHWNRAGHYPVTNTDIRNYLADTKSGAYMRFTNEGMDGISANNRPLPYWLSKFWSGMNTFTMEEAFLWGIEFNHEPLAPGTDDPRTEIIYSSDAVIEGQEHSLHRYSVYDPIHTGGFKWCWFNVPYYNYNNVDGHYFHQKAILFGKIRNVNNIAVLEFWAAYPASDGKPTTFRVWVNNGNTSSYAYSCTIENGREYFYDAWRLPSNFAYADLAGKDIYVEYTDITGTQRIYRGDFREAIGNVQIPALYPVTNVNV